MYDIFEGMNDDNIQYSEYLKRTRQDTRVKIIDELERRKQFTPDFRELRLRTDILVFVYDEFKKKGLQNPILVDSKYLGEGRTTNNQFFMKNSAHFPVVFQHRKEGHPNKGFIRGEVYAVPPETLLRLDKVKSNLVMFKRVSKHITLMDQEFMTKKGNKKPTVECFTYLGVPEFWEKETSHVAPSTMPQGIKEKRFYEYTVKAAPSQWAQQDYYKRNLNAYHGMMH